MSHRGPRAIDVVLTDAERRELEQVSVGDGRASVRARIVLNCADGASNAAVAQQLSVSVATVGSWRSRFVASRIGRLLDEPRTAGHPSILLD